MKSLLVAIGVVLLLTSFADAQEFRRKDETFTEYIGRSSREYQESRMRERQIRANEDLVNALRQNRNRQYEIRREGNRIIIDED